MELPLKAGDSRRAKVRMAGGPPNGVRLVTEGINAVAAAAPPLGGLELARGDSLTAPAGGSEAAPMPVYDLGLDDLAAGGGVEKAQQRSWLYLLYANDKLTRCADLSVAAAGGGGPGGGEPRFTGVTTAYVRELDAALHEAEHVPDDGEYELRLLRATPVHSAAVWLKRTDAAGDRFLLLPPVTRKDPAPTPFTAAELFDHWQARAKERKAQIAQATADAPSN